MPQRSVVRLSAFCLSLAVMLSALLAWVLAGGREVMGQTTNSSGNQELPVLELNKPVDSELTVGQTHNFRLDLKAGQFVKVEVEQQGIDVVVQLFSPDKMNTPQVDAEPWGHGTEVILWEAAITGTFRVEVQALHSISLSGRYVIRWTKVDEPTERERGLAKASRLCAQAIIHLPNRKYDEGIRLAEESLALRENLLPPNDPAIAESLHWLTWLVEDRGYYNDQERIDQLYARRLQILERAFGPDHPYVARWLNALANRAELVRAVELFQRGLTILEKSYGTDHPDVGFLLSNYAIKLDARGDYERAGAMYKRAADILEKTTGQGDILAQSLNNLGDFYLVRDDYEHAEPLLQRALAIWTKVHGRENGRTAIAIENLGDLYRRKGDFARAEQLAKESLEICQQVPPPNNHTVGEAHHRLGLLYLEMGDYLRAEQSLKKAQAILDPFSGRVNMDIMVAAMLRTRVRLALAMGKNDEAIAYQRRVTEISESELNNVLAFGSGEDKLDFLKVLADETNDTLSLHARFAPNDTQALNLALTTWLQRKGRVLDEMNRSIGLLRRAAGNESASLFNEWATKLSQRSRLTTTEPDSQSQGEHQAKIKQLNSEIRQLESTISARSVEFRTQVLPPVTTEEVRAALPPETALIEFAQYQLVDPRTNKKSPARYLAYVLPKAGALRSVELGEVAKIDDGVRTLRQAITDKDSGIDLRLAARKLDELVMQPIRPKLGQAKTIFLSPDGELNLAPFAAFRDERGRYLIEDYLFIHLTSGRDLLRLKIKHQSQPDKLIFAINDFGEKPGIAPPIAKAGSSVSPNLGFDDTRSNRLSADTTMATLQFDSLKHTHEEAKAVQRIFPEARPFLDAQAIETALKQVHRPYFLHLATHGFFLANASQKWENPLLRSGLAFAGANQRESGKDDGILTAFEAAALDLWGTKLVVLSACETGNGEVKNGEGVFGLRRALVLAGAETQVSSLWKADDLVTRKLMEKFYGNLNKGIGRAEALQKAQLEILRGGVNPAPYYWANFICIGEWKPLEK